MAVWAEGCHVIRPSVEQLSVVERDVLCPEPNCGRRLPHWSALRLHITRHHHRRSLLPFWPRSSARGEVAFACPVEPCPAGHRYFKTFKLLKQHYMKTHAPRPLCCQRCRVATFATAALLRAHETACLARFGCECGAVYAHKSSLAQHVKKYGHKLAVIVQKTVLQADSSSNASSSSFASVEAADIKQQRHEQHEAGRTSPTHAEPTRQTCSASVEAASVQDDHDGSSSSSSSPHRSATQPPISHPKSDTFCGSPLATDEGRGGVCVTRDAGSQTVCVRQQAPQQHQKPARGPRRRSQQALLVARTCQTTLTLRQTAATSQPIISPAAVANMSAVRSVAAQCSQIDREEIIRCHDVMFSSQHICRRSGGLLDRACQTPPPSSSSSATLSCEDSGQVLSAHTQTQWSFDDIEHLLTDETGGPLVVTSQTCGHHDDGVGAVMAAGQVLFPELSEVTAVDGFTQTY